MALSETEIANLALRHLGQGVEISDLSTDPTAAGRALRKFYADARDELLREADWSFARKYAPFVLIAQDPPEASPEWGYSYQVPPDALRVLKIRSGLRPGLAEPPIPFEVVEGGKLYTTIEDAKAIYTARVTNPASYPADFTLALSLRLAAYIAPSVTAGDPFFLQRRSLELFQLSIQKAKLASLRERDLGPPPESPFVSERA